MPIRTLSSTAAVLSKCFPSWKCAPGSNLIEQFQASYIPRVLCMTSPRYVGGPDFLQQLRKRRRFDDAPEVSLQTFTAMMAARCEYQFRADWDLNPGLLSLSFSTKGQPMNVNVNSKSIASRCSFDRRRSESRWSSSEHLHTTMERWVFRCCWNASSNCWRHHQNTVCHRTERDGNSFIAKLPFHVEPHPRHSPSPTSYSTYHLQQARVLRHPGVHDHHTERTTFWSYNVPRGLKFIKDGI